MGKKLKWLFPILYEVICAFFAYVSSSESFLLDLQNKGILGTEVNVSNVREICLLVSIVLSTFLLTINLIHKQHENDKIQSQRDMLLKLNKDNLGIVLKDYSSNFDGFDMRFFVPKNQLLYSFCQLLNIKKFKHKFIVKNIPILANEGATKNLEFEVFPNPQGLVGKCFQEQAIQLDDKLEQTNSVNYNLKSSQLSRTTNLKWSI